MSNGSTIRELDIMDIQDDEDIYDRIKINNLKKKKKKKKAKIISYGEEEEEVGNDDKVVLLSDKVNEMNEKLKNLQKPKLKLTEPKKQERKQDILVSFDNEKRVLLCKLILENFEILNIWQYFESIKHSNLEIHNFKLFIYSIIHNHDKFFCNSNKDTFIQIFNQLARANEISKKFNERFVNQSTQQAEREKENQKQIYKELPRRSIEKISIPPIILKRLDIQSS